MTKPYRVEAWTGQSWRHVCSCAHAGSAWDRARRAADAWFTPARILLEGKVVGEVAP